MFRNFYFVLFIVQALCTKNITPATMRGRTKSYAEDYTECFTRIQSTGTESETGNLFEECAKKMSENDCTFLQLIELLFKYSEIQLNNTCALLYKIDYCTNKIENAKYNSPYLYSLNDLLINVCNNPVYREGFMKLKKCSSNEELFDKITKCYYDAILSPKSTCDDVNKFYACLKNGLLNGTKSCLDLQDIEYLYRELFQSRSDFYVQEECLNKSSGLPASQISCNMAVINKCYNGLGDLVHFTQYGFSNIEEICKNLLDAYDCFHNHGCFNNQRTANAVSFMNLYNTLNYVCNTNNKEAFTDPKDCFADKKGYGAEMKSCRFIVEEISRENLSKADNFCKQLSLQKKCYSGVLNKYKCLDMVHFEEVFNLRDQEKLNIILPSCQLPVEKLMKTMKTLYKTLYNYLFFLFI